MPILLPDLRNCTHRISLIGFSVPYVYDDEGSQTAASAALLREAACFVVKTYIDRNFGTHAFSFAGPRCFDVCVDAGGTGSTPAHVCIDVPCPSDMDPIHAAHSLEKAWQESEWADGATYFDIIDRRN